MVRIVADQADIESHISRLVDLIASNGGFVHHDLIIVSEGGGLSVQAPRSVSEQSELISVPRELLLPTADFDLYLSGDDICIGSSAAPLSATQSAVMEEMLAIYNLCEKIRIHREMSPVRLFYEAPETFEALVLPTQFSVRKKLPAKDPILHDFLHTRVFAAKAVSGDETQSVLMPIIDFLNHHRGAGGFKMGDAGLLVNRHSPLADTDECFVSYSRMDAQVAFAVYGFVDEEADSLWSVPAKIDLPGIGTIEVSRRQGAKNHGKVPPPLKDIARLVPQMGLSREFKRGQFSHLVIPPPGFPRSMRRILKYMIRSLAGDMPAEKLKTLIEEAERQVIEANLNYYEGMKDRARTASVSQELQPIVDDASRMADIQLNLIRAYVTRMERTEVVQAPRRGI